MLTLEGTFLDRVVPGLRDPDQHDTVTIDVAGIGASFHERGEVSWMPGDITWVGQNPERPTDELIITVYEDAVAGYALLDGESFVVTGQLDGDWTLLRPTASGFAIEAAQPLDPPTNDDTGAQLDTGAAIEATGGLTLTSYALEMGEDPTEWAPYQSYDEVIDLLVVYGPPALSLHGSEAAVVATAVNHVAVMNEAFHNSTLNYAVRLVGVEDIGWDSSANTGEALQELIAGTHGAEEVDTLRDATGADVILGLYAFAAHSTHGTADGNAGVAQGNFTPSSSTDDRFHMAIRGHGTPTTAAHELGHLLGLGHGRRATDFPNVPPYAFGYHWPDELEVFDPAEVCPTEPFVTLMSQLTEVTIGSTDFDLLGRDILQFSNPDVDVSRCPLNPEWVQTGSTDLDPTTYQWADASRAIDEHAGWLAAYRPARSPTFGEGATVVSPASGGTVSGTATFTWTSTSPTDDYVLEVYNPTTGSSYAYLTVSGTTSATASGLPTDGSIVAVRLWTLVGSATNPQWTWVDHRYNNANQLVDCATDPGASGLDPFLEPQYHFGTCDDTVGPVCSYAGGVLTCDLDRGANIDNPELYAVSAFYSSGEAYDLLVYGHGDNDEPFCCLANDPNGQIGQLRVQGSSRPDGVWLHDAYGRNLTAYDGPLEALVDGNGGADVLAGSNADHPDYTEVLKGGPGMDVIDGWGGDDVLRPGTGGAVMHGGAGDDVLLGGPGADALYGDEGADNLCTQQLADLLDGGDAATVQVDHLYVSQGATGAPHPDTVGRYDDFCGHTIHGTFAGPDCIYNRISAPPACAALGIPD